MVDKRKFKLPMVQSPSPNERSNILPNIPAREASPTILDVVIRHHHLTNDIISKRDFISHITVSRARNGRLISVDSATKICERINELVAEKEALQQDKRYKFDNLFKVINQSLVLDS